jgi:hypothetical protein
MNKRKLRDQVYKHRLLRPVPLRLTPEGLFLPTTSGR